MFFIDELVKLEWIMLFWFGLFKGSYVVRIFYYFKFSVRLGECSCNINFIYFRLVV